MTEIAFAGDWHGNAAWAELMINSVGLRGIKTIIHTGDYGYLFRQSYVEAVESALVEAGATLLFVDGNHDNHRLLAGLESDEDGFGELTKRQRHIPRGHRFTLGETTLLGLGGAVSVDRNWRRVERSWWPTEFITYPELKRAEAGGLVDVMITHDCPLGVDIPVLRKASGWPEDALRDSAANRHTVRRVVDKVKPKRLVHGHYHCAYEAMLNGTHVIGLNCDGTTWQDNIVTLELP